MAITLREWSAANGIPYSTAHYQYSHKKLPVPAQKRGNVIYVDAELPAVPKQALGKRMPLEDISLLDSAVAGTTRTNRSATIERIDRFKNLTEVATPFKRVQGGTLGSSLYSIRDIVVLCQNAYYACHQVRNAIETMVVFSNSEIFWEGGTKKSREFFKTLFDEVRLWDMANQFFREGYRSGTIPIYRFETEIDDARALRMSRAAGGVLKSSAGSVRLPLKYAILNPAEILVADGLSYIFSQFYRRIEGSELVRMKLALTKPEMVTDTDRQIAGMLPPELKQQIVRGGGLSSVIQPLDPSKFQPVFFQKQDYEPLAVPMVYPTLDALSFRLELEKMDAALARTWQQVLLLVTNGSPTDQYGNGTNPQNIAELQSIFKNQSIGRVLVADYTTKAEWKIPQIADLLDPKKYAVLDQQIREGLNNILFGDEKFANSSIRIRVFVERLGQGRENFMKGFLIPEVKRISEEMGFRDYPTPRFSDFDLQDTTQYNRIYSRLVEIGALTPDDGVRAIQTGKLPTPEENLESQQKLKEAKDKGLFQPLLVAKQDNGRPGGTGTPQSGQRQSSPIGTSNAKFGIGLVAKNLALAKELEAATAKLLKGRKGSNPEAAAHMVMAAEAPENWLASAKAYASGEKKPTQDQLAAVFKVMDDHQVDFATAAVLMNSPGEEPEATESFSPDPSGTEPARPCPA